MAAASEFLDAPRREIPSTLTGGQTKNCVQPAIGCGPEIIYRHTRFAEFAYLHPPRNAGPLVACLV